MYQGTAQEYHRSHQDLTTIEFQRKRSFWHSVTISHQGRHHPHRQILAVLQIHTTLDHHISIIMLTLKVLLSVLFTIEVEELLGS